MKHGGSSYSSWDAINTVTHYKSAQILGSIVPGSDGPLPADTLRIALNYTRSDGFESAFGTVQGTRSDKDGWTTPDAYLGEVHDPMSQKSFIWNRNNPYGYSDPSGYITEGDNLGQLAREIFMRGLHDIVCPFTCRTSSSPKTAPRGSNGPVTKGEAGVQQSILGATARGETVLGAKSPWRQSRDFAQRLIL